MSTTCFSLVPSFAVESAAPGHHRNLSPSELRSATTPWGVPDLCQVFLPGICLYHTPGHGGFHLSSTRMAQLPKALSSFPTFNGHVGWFEEDCDWCYAVLGFPRVFSDRLLDSAFKQALGNAAMGPRYQSVATWLQSSAEASFLRERVAQMKPEALKVG